MQMKSDAEYSVSSDLSQEDSQKKPGKLTFLTDWKPVAITPVDPNLSRVEQAIVGTTQLPMKRALTARHVGMIAIGGTIGSGLFVGTGTTIAYAGAGGTLIGYAYMGIFLLLMMCALGELGVRYPVTGAFSAYTSRFMHMSWGFAVGWNYALGWLISLPSELIAAAVTIQYWKNIGISNGATNVNPAAWVGLFFALIAAINVFGVRGYGEAEFFFSSLKILAIIGFIICGIVITCGGGPTHEYLGGKYWHNPGAFNNGAKGVFDVFATAAYAFGGVEFAGLNAMETTAPHKVIPKATKQVFWRIMVFYIVTVIVIGCLVPYNNPLLGLTSDASASPFVIAIKNAGIKGLDSVMNVVIIIATFSVGNSCIYGSTRTIVSLAAQGHAPRFFLWIDRQGRPVAALILSLIWGCIGFVCATPNYYKAFNWLSTLAGLSAQMIWGSICICHIRHRKAMKAQGVSLDELEYKSPFGQIGSYIGVFMVIFILAMQFWVALFPIGSNGKASAESFFQTWVSACIMLVSFLGHYIWYRDPWIPAKDLDITTGVRVTDREALKHSIAEDKAAMAAKPFIVRCWNFWC